MNNTMNNKLFIQLLGPAAGQAKIVPVTGELVVSHTECCIFTLRNIKIRERVLGCLVFVFLDEVPNRTCCVVGVILFH